MTTGTPRRRVLLAAVLLLVLTGVGWVLDTERTLDAVEVTTGTPECEGAEVRGTGEIRARAGMRCRLPVSITNGGGRGVRVGGVVLPFLGPRGGGVVRAGTIEGYPAVEGEDPIDRAVAVEETLAPGDSRAFAVPLVFRERGCNGPGGRVTMGDMPMVEVSYLRRTRTVSSAGELVYSQVGPSRGCRTSGD